MLCCPPGGVIHSSGGSSVALTNAVFANNKAGGHGGAIYADTDSQLLSDATSFSNNSAGGNGGAVYHNGFFPSMAGAQQIRDQISPVFMLQFLNLFIKIVGDQGSSV